MRAEQELEREWWGDCANTFHEEEKQLVYATRMGLTANWHVGHPPEFDLQGRSVADFGGGPASLLLKTVNAGERWVVDPCRFPEWVYDRYAQCGINFHRTGAEAWKHPDSNDRLDEIWIYNVLQHVEDPERVVWNARSWAETVRLFEWIDIEPYDGHPHKLTAANLEEWLGDSGIVEDVCENGAMGRAFYGSFAGVTIPG